MVNCDLWRPDLKGQLAVSAPPNIQGLALTKTYAISGSTLTLTAANGDTMTFAAK